MKKVEISKKTEIDWKIRQWVQHKQMPNLIILTNPVGKSDFESSFCGTVLPCEDYPKGCYTTNLNKNLFQLLESEIPFIISNNN